MRSAWDNEGREVCSFFVEGTPVPQGSKQAFVIPGSNRAVMTEANKNLPAWRNEIALAAAVAMGTKDIVVGGTPVKIVVTFGFPRPKSHFGTGSKSDVLKQSAPLFKASTPDTDKLCRALGDAMSGIVYHDDAQVAEWQVRRTYSSRPGAYVFVYAL